MTSVREFTVQKHKKETKYVTPGPLVCLLLKLDGEEIGSTKRQRCELKLTDT